jgi:AcrR family transcriptional regulator
MTEIESPRRGRPRDAATHEAILEATRSLLDESGYVGLTIEGVAARAETAKSTVYRWWPTKGALVLEAALDSISIGSVPDTGDTRQDLSIAIRQLIGTFTDRLAGIVIFAVIAGLDDDPTLAAAFREVFVYPWRTTAAQALERGMARGDLPPDLDVEFTLDVIVGVAFQRTLVTAEPMTEGLDEAILDLVLPSG